MKGMNLELKLKVLIKQPYKNSVLNGRSFTIFSKYVMSFLDNK
jgi:hypothetical protein